MIIRTSCAGILAAVVLTHTAWAQTTTAGAKNASAAQVTALAGGWRYLADGDAARAARVASDLLTRDPRSSAVLSFAIEVEIVRGGAASALGAYERWLNTRPIEEPYSLRRVASALLRETAAGDKDRAIRLAAVEALIADGDLDAAALLPPAQSTAPAESGVRATTGNATAVDALITLAAQPGPGRRAAVAALSRSRSPRATPVLVGALTDSDPTVRAAAAEALGALQAGSAVARLKPLVDDPVVSVRIAAAGALLALHDSSGMPLLRQLQTSEYPAIRLAAARAAASDAGPEWLAVVRELTKDSDPDVRRQAAELIAPHDPDLAKATLEPLLADPNPAMRQAAADSYVISTSDVSVLRRYLRDADSGTRVRAADRVLQLTR
jgi:HEAT repeat protein